MGKQNQETQKFENGNLTINIAILCIKLGEIKCSVDTGHGLEPPE